MTKKSTKAMSKLPEERTEEQSDLSAATAPRPSAKDRAGFDLGGAVTDATAGSGLGLGRDSAESRADRRLARNKSTT